MPAKAGAGPEPPGAAPGVEAVRRHAPDGSRGWPFLLNHGADPVRLPPAAVGPGHDLLTGREVGPSGLLLPPGGSAVVRQG